MIKKRDLEKAIHLFLVSFLTLYFEILFIRYTPSSLHTVAYFVNIILISAFLGLGIGCLVSEKKFNLISLFPLLVFIYAVLLLIFNDVQLDTTFIRAEHLTGVQSGKANLLLVIFIVFIFNTSLFIPLGQKLGQCLRYFKPLISYSINILGSILGVVVFSCLSYLMIRPFFWFLIGLALATWLYKDSKKKLLLQIFIFALTLIVVSQINKTSHWSPYSRIDLRPLMTRGMSPKKLGLEISVNNMFHQYAFDLRDRSVAAWPELRHYRDIYEFPYVLTRPESVLILGAGSGNDAAAALRMGSKDIYAVEIDPFIAELGKTLHEERPYISEDLNLIVDDARSFVRRANKKFDLITFGYLDAHGVLSQFSSVRMDNFIYTRESFEDIKRHLSKDGLLSLTYFVFEEWVGAKLYVTLKEVFGDGLKVFRTSTYAKDDTVIFLAGPKAREIKDIYRPDFRPDDSFDATAQPISDDWPYLYLVKKGIPWHYIVILLFILVASVLGVFCANPLTLRRFNAHFFFLGSGFMLLETVSITRFALLFGSTWIVNSAVIISILTMILLSTLYVARAGRVNIKLAYGLLISSLLLNWFLSPEFYLSFNKIGAILASSFVLSLPILFASIIFATSFKNVKGISSVFGYNLLGAIAGGCCEYFSMLTGFRFLFIIAILMYGLSYITRNLTNRS